MTAATLHTVPIDEAARNGRYQIVIGDCGMFALVRWTGEAWEFSSKVPLDFEPTRYHPAGVA